MKIKFWHTWRLLRLNPGAQGEHLPHQPVSTAFTSDCPVYLVDELVLVSLPHYDNDGSIEVQADQRWKIYGLIIWSWSKQWEILLAVISKSCFWWFWIAGSYRGGLKLRKLVINDWVYVFLELFWGMGGGWWAVEMACTYLGDFCWKVQIRKNGWGDHWKKNFFINNSVGLSMCDGPIETVKYIWVNIWCMLDWIFSQYCKNPLPLHTELDAVVSRRIPISQRQRRFLSDKRI